MARRRRIDAESPASTDMDTQSVASPENLGEPVEGSSDSQGQIKADTGPTPVEAKPEVKPKLSIPMNSDGTFDIEGMRQTTRERLLVGVKAFRDKTPEARPAEPIEVPRPLIESVYTLLGGIEGWLATRATKLPADLVAPVFQYSRPELDALVPMTQAALAEWDIPAIPYPHTVALAVMLVKVHIAKVGMLKTMLAVNAQPADQRVNGVDHQTAHAA